MTEQENQTNTMLCEHIARIFSEGIHLDRKAVHFLNSIGSIGSAAELEEVLSDPDSDDRDVIFELVFFPDEKARIRLEPLLQTSVFTRADELAVIGMLGRRPLTAKIEFPGSEHLSIEVPGHALRSFVSRLYMDRVVPGELVRELHGRFEESEAFRLISQVRCRFATLCSAKTAFLCGIIQSDLARMPAFSRLFAHALNLLQEMPLSVGSEEEIARCLISKREELKKTLVRIRHFHDVRQKQSMEELMLSGYTVPPESEEEVGLGLRMLNQIIRFSPSCAAGFPPDQPIHKNVGSLDKDDDIEKVFNLFK